METETQDQKKWKQRHKTACSVGIDAVPHHPLPSHLQPQAKRTWSSRLSIISTALARRQPAPPDRLAASVVRASDDAIPSSRMAASWHRQQGSREATCTHASAHACTHARTHADMHTQDTRIHTHLPRVANQHQHTGEQTGAARKGRPSVAALSLTNT